MAVNTIARIESVEAEVFGQFPYAVLCVSNNGDMHDLPIA